MKILVAAGASGGHIFPAIAFLDALKEKDPRLEALLVLPKSSKGKYHALSAYKSEYISVVPLSIKLSFRSLLAVFNLLKGFLESFFILARFRADALVGFGSISCLPLVLLAWLFRVKTVIHEQNVMPGAANRFMAVFADKIAVSFEETKKYLPKYANKVFFSGNPVRNKLKPIDKKNALDFFQFSPNKYTLLACGGSKGSSSINQGFLEAVSALCAEFNFQVIHLSGAGGYEKVKRTYEGLKLESRVYPFFEDMQYVYSVADLAVCRAGAGTISELAIFCLPAVIFPYPYAYQHQRANAEAIAQREAALILEEADLGNGRLQELIKAIIFCPGKLAQMRKAYQGVLSAPAADCLAQAVLFSD